MIGGVGANMIPGMMPGGQMPGGVGMGSMMPKNLSEQMPGEVFPAEIAAHLNSAKALDAAKAQAAGDLRAPSAANMAANARSTPIADTVLGVFIHATDAPRQAAQEELMKVVTGADGASMQKVGMEMKKSDFNLNLCSKVIQLSTDAVTKMLNAQIG
jgi:hypothetical protein